MSSNNVFERTFQYINIRNFSCWPHTNTIFKHDVWLECTVTTRPLQHTERNSKYVSFDFRHVQYWRKILLLLHFFFSQIMIFWHLALLNSWFSLWHCNNTHSKAIENILISSLAVFVDFLCVFSHSYQSWQGRISEMYMEDRNDL